MIEQDRRRLRSPLESERGSTNIKDSVVSKIAGMAAAEVEGIRMGGSASRAAGGILEGVTGSQSLSRGVSVEVGRIETAIDVTMGVEYGRNILQLAESVRNKITERVENLTGLRVAELNVTVSDVIFPDQGTRGGEAERRGRLRDEGRPLLQQTGEIGAGSRERETDDTEPLGIRTRAQPSTEVGRGLREEGFVESVPLEEDETAELRNDDEEPGRGGRRER